MIAALLAAAALAAGGPFDYDASAPLDVREAGTRIERDARVIDLSYASPTGARVPAYLVLPQGRGPFPGVIAQPGGFAGRDVGLFEAAELARRGLAVLTIDGPQARSGRTDFACTAADAREFHDYVVELRRGLDLLQARPEVDGARLGYTGFSFGAETGGALVGVDHRLRAAALQSGSGRVSTVWRSLCSRAPKALLARFRRLDPINFIARARPAALLIQNGRFDGTFPRKEVLAFQRAASRPKTVRWYASRHQLPAGASYQRDDFLARVLRAGTSRLAVAEGPRAAEVRSLAEQMERLHPNLFHDVTRADFERAAEELAQRADSLDRAAYVVELMRLTAMPGPREGHGGVFTFWPHRSPLHFFPLRLYRFPEGYVVVRARDATLVRARLVAIEGRPLAEVEQRVRPLVPHDNEWSMIERLPEYLVCAEVLRGLGIAADDGVVTFTLETAAGGSRDVRLHAGGLAFGAFFEPLLPAGRPTLLLQTRNQRWRLTTLERGRVVYLAYNQVVWPESMPARLLKLALRKNVRRVIVDLRLNGGGDNSRYLPLLDALQRIGKRRALRVLIGRDTFSAAGSFAADLDRYTNAVFVGEPTGGAPSQYGDATTIELPLAGLSVRVATSYQQFDPPGSQRLAVEPDVAVAVSAAEFFAGRDPVLAAALAR